MAEAVFMPRLGQSVESCIITEWVKKKGEVVKTGDVLFCYETDKAAFEETAKSDGILLEVFYQEGDEVPVLANVGVIGKAGENIESFRANPEQAISANKTNDSPSANQHSEIQPPTATQIIPDKKIKISPRAKRLAETLSINLSAVIGSGPNGRIIVRDLEHVGTPPLMKNESVSTFKSVITSSSIDYSEVPLSNIRKIIAKGMHASLQNSAQLTHHTSADARKILEFRSIIKGKSEKGEVPNITLNDMVCFAVIRALQKTPAMNSQLHGDRIRTFSKVHLGIAVDTERGLMVPVIRDADDLNLRALSVKIKSLAESCKKGNVDPELLQSDKASFTVSNLGSYGIEMFTPVINLPQVGILGVNTIIYRPSDIGNGIIGIIPVIGLSLTYDHRAIDGAPASAFLAEVRNQIQSLSQELI